MARNGCDWRRICRLATLGFVVAAAAFIVSMVAPWVSVFLNGLPRNRIAIGVLVGVKIAYGVVLVSSLIGTIVLGAIFSHGRRRRMTRPMVARGLLLCGTCLISLAFAEVVAARWGAPPRSMPAAAARDPELPTRFTEDGDKDEVTLVVVGESSAAGAPFERWLSVGQIIAWKLAEAIPGRRFHAEVLANLGDTLETQYHRLAELRRRPDAVIVYCGHNEFSARNSWARTLDYYHDDEPSLPTALERLAREPTPLCHLIERAIDRHRIAMIPPPAFKPRLVDAPVYTTEEFAANLADFRRRLEAITAFATRVGALPILVVPAGNDAGFEPLRSFLRPETPRREREAFARDFRAVRQLEAFDPARAIDEYRALLAREPGFAECHYRLARLLEEAGDWEEAYRQYIAARDLDGMPMRCLSAFQQVYLDVARSHDCVVVNAQTLFHAIGPHGLLDDTLFIDVVHPSLRGHIALAGAILDALRVRGSWGWPRGVPTPAIDPAECAAHFGLRSSAWTEVCGGGQMFYWAAGNLRHDPGQCRAKEQAYREAFRRIQAGEPPESLGLPNVGIPAALPDRSARQSGPGISEGWRPPLKPVGESNQKSRVVSWDRSGP